MRSKVGLTWPFSDYQIWRLIGLVVYTVAVFPIISLQIVLNPSNAPPGPPALGAVWVAAITGLVIVLNASAWLVFFRRPTMAWLLVPLVTAFGSVWLLGTHVHRDYFSAYMPAGLSCWVAYLVSFRGMMGVERARNQFRALTIASGLIWLTTMQWLILMSYSIVTRTEPRWAEATVYNLYNMVYLVILYWAWNRVYLNHQKTVLLLTPDHVSINGIDLSLVFGSGGRLTMLALVEAWRQGGSMTCATFHQRPGNGSGTCLAESCKVSQCTEYRNLYNQVLGVKKIVEAFKLGTIQGPDNKRQIRTEGWSFQPGRTVHVIVNPLK